MMYPKWTLDELKLNDVINDVKFVYCLSFHIFCNYVIEVAAHAIN